MHGGESVSDLVPMMYKHKLTQRYTGISDDFTATGGHLITLCGIRVGLRDDPMPDRATECSACLFAEQMRDADM